MTVFSPSKTHRLPKLFLLLLPLVLLFCGGCKKSVNYLDYVSELRSNIFLAKTEDFSLRIYAVNKETPYATDGIPEKCTPRVEAYLVAPDGTKSAELELLLGEKSLGGEMSYDNVKCEYFYSATADISELYSIPCTLRYGDTEVQLTATSVKTEQTLTPKAALDKLTGEYPELFQELTDEYGFAGEIYLRLIYEDAPYYYVGVIDKEGNIEAFLLNAQTGKILARRGTS